MANVGYATLQVIPSVRGIGDELRRQLVGPAGDAGGDAGDAAGGGFGDAFKGAMAAVGIAELASKIGEQFGEAFNSAIEQANVTTTLQNQLGSSGQAASNQGAAVGQLFAKGVTDEFAQGAEAIRAVVSGGLAPPQATVKQLTVIGTKMTDVANTFGTDMSLQSQAVSAILKNKLAPDASKALDLITVGFQRLGPNAEDLLETFQEYPVQLKKLGLDAQTSMGLFQQGMQGGARDTDIVADALKEFSIRSIDMSQGSQDAYKALGLSAKDMSLQISKGGAGATAGLQTVLDRLRSIHDPVARNAAAVGIFGTQAEELGAALFKLDPGKATKAFADVGGAADKLGANFRSGPSYEITLFKRTLQQGLVNFIGGKVLPILADWGGVLDNKVLPPLVTVGGILSDAFLPTLATIGAGLSDTVGWFKEWGIWLTPLAILIGGVTLALSAEAIATGVVTGIFSLYSAAIGIGTVVTEGFAGAQAVLNAVMAINPFVLIAIALVALIALVVIAWKNSETFRSIVTAAWEGIKTAAMWAWNGFLKPALDGFMVGLRVVGKWASWLWTTILAPVFGYIALGAKILATALAVIMFGPMYLGFKVLGAVAGWLWTNAISPMIDLIIGGFQLWWAGVKIYFALVMAAFRAVGVAAMWLWTNAISPAINFIVAGFQLWWTGVKLYFGLVKTGVTAVGNAFMWLWTNWISPAIDRIGRGASSLYNTLLKPPLDKAMELARSLGQAFVAAKDIIGTQFGKIADLAKKPISFIIDTVYNHGIRGVWNMVASAFGAPQLDQFKGFAAGGAVHGPGTETSDSVLSRLSRNEHVWTAKEVRGAGGHGAVMGLRQMAAQGQLGLPGFKDGGGIFGWIGSAASAVKGAGSAAWNTVKSGANWLKESLAGSARAGVEAVVRPLLRQIPGLNTGFGKMVAGIPNRMVDALFGYADKADEKGASASAAAAGGGQLGSWIAKAMGLTHVPASWAGPLHTLIMRESGGNPNAINLTDSNAQAGYPSQGLMQTIPQTFAAYALPGLGGITDPIANIVAGIRYILSRYGSIFNVQQAVGSTPKGYASGGSPRPGEIAWVGEHGKELLRFSGGETIYDHDTSMRMTAGVGARGFALGSPASRAAAAAARSASATVPASALATRHAADQGDVHVRVFVGNEEITKIVRTEVEYGHEQLATMLNAGRSRQ